MVVVTWPPVVLTVQHPPGGRGEDRQLPCWKVVHLMVLAQLNCCCFGSSSVDAGVVVESRVARFDAVGGSIEA